MPLREASVERRGFCCSPAAAERLERIGETFLRGYHTALENRSADAIAATLDGAFPPETRGFAFEGAAMGLVLLDRFRLERRSFDRFLQGPGSPHLYMLHVGAGWAFARLPWIRRNLAPALQSFDPVLRWLVVDGVGFHEGYFHWAATVRRQRVPFRLSGYTRRAFDQGLGRSLWFVEGIDVNRIARTVNSFATARQSDL